MVWAALNMSLAIYVVVLVILAPERRPDSDLVSLVLLALSVPLAGASFFGAYFTFARVVRMQQALRPLGFRPILARGARPSSPFTQVVMVRCALAEAIGVMGFVVAFVGGPVQFSAAMFILGWIMLGLAFPTEQMQASLKETVEPSEA